LQCMCGQRRLPKDADPENIQSKYQDGVLIITIGKKAVRQHPRELEDENSHLTPWAGTLACALVPCMGANSPA
jgi:hypothetical protein